MLLNWIPCSKWPRGMLDSEACWIASLYKNHWVLIVIAHNESWIGWTHQHVIILQQILWYFRLNGCYVWFHLNNRYWCHKEINAFPVLSEYYGSSIWRHAGTEHKTTTTAPFVWCHCISFGYTKHVLSCPAEAELETNNLPYISRGHCSVCKCFAEILIILSSWGRIGDK